MLEFKRCLSLEVLFKVGKLAEGWTWLPDLKEPTLIEPLLAHLSRVPMKQEENNTRQRSEKGKGQVVANQGRTHQLSSRKGHQVCAAWKGGKIDEGINHWKRGPSNRIKIGRCTFGGGREFGFLHGMARMIAFLQRARRACASVAAATRGWSGRTRARIKEEVRRSSVSLPVT